ncbi:hypothetical protein AVEN_86520-1 [Araneus ventricosus]|uniref:Uncharacterized protein n=1 Tax=Araneus ventricosus TaxID=182803 RepID=A0A4Y2PSI4_ARAVE|nr:hypothetical protein AVEN_86520-1 [Araneus ventricosus]
MHLVYFDSEPSIRSSNHPNVPKYLMAESSARRLADSRPAEDGRCTLNSSLSNARPLVWCENFEKGTISDAIWPCLKIMCSASISNSVTSVLDANLMNQPVLNLYSATAITVRGSDVNI